MTGASFELDEPTTFTAGTVGEPGSRVFFLQAQQSGAVVTLRIEKEQVSTLGEYLGGLLENLAPTSGAPPENLDLIQPAVEEWIIGSLAVAYSEVDDRIIIVAEELAAEELVPESESGLHDSDPLGHDSPAVARFHLTREQVAAFVPHVAAVVAAGRPVCPVCGQPVDADGHICARSNGHGH